MFGFASIPDLLRLVAIPFFAVVAVRDVRTRRIANRTWFPLAALAAVLLVWETSAVMSGGATGIERQQFFTRVMLSVGFLIPLSYLFYLMGGFGGADAKAFFVIAVLFPTYPEYGLGEFGLEGALATLPVVQTTVGVFSLTILSNTVLAGMAYPFVLAARNAAKGFLSPGMFVAKPVRWDETTQEYGTILEFPDRRLRADLSLSGLRGYFSWRRLDLDALRMYLQWRGCTLADIREAPAVFRNPASVPDDPHPPGDGSMATDGGDADETGADSSKTGECAAGGDEPTHDDPWGVEAFLDDIEGSAYGTHPEDLREGLELLVKRDVVWISPGIPFLVPLFIGLVVAFTYGDLLFAGMRLIGLA